MSKMQSFGEIGGQPLRYRQNELSGGQAMERSGGGEKAGLGAEVWELYDQPAGWTEERSRNDKAAATQQQHPCQSLGNPLTTTGKAPAAAAGHFGNGTFQAVHQTSMMSASQSPTNNNSAPYYNDPQKSPFGQPTLFSLSSSGAVLSTSVEGDAGFLRDAAYQTTAEKVRRFRSGGAVGILQTAAVPEKDLTTSTNNSGGNIKKPSEYDQQPQHHSLHPMHPRQIIAEVKRKSQLQQQSNQSAPIPPQQSPSSPYNPTNVGVNQISESPIRSRYGSATTTDEVLSKDDTMLPPISISPFATNKTSLPSLTSTSSPTGGKKFSGAVDMGASDQASLAAVAVARSSKGDIMDDLPTSFSEFENKERLLTLEKKLSSPLLSPALSHTNSSFSPLPHHPNSGSFNMQAGGQTGEEDVIGPDRTAPPNAEDLEVQMINESFEEQQKQREMYENPNLKEAFYNVPPKKPEEVELPAKPYPKEHNPFPINNDTPETTAAEQSISQMQQPGAVSSKAKTSSTTDVLFEMDSGAAAKAAYVDQLASCGFPGGSPSSVNQEENTTLEVGGQHSSHLAQPSSAVGRLLEIPSLLLQEVVNDTPHPHEVYQSTLSSTGSVIFNRQQPDQEQQDTVELPPITSFLSPSPTAQNDENPIFGATVGAQNFQTDNDDVEEGVMTDKAESAGGVTWAGWSARPDPNNPTASEGTTERIVYENKQPDDDDVAHHHKIAIIEGDSAISSIDNGQLPTSFYFNSSSSSNSNLLNFIANAQPHQAGVSGSRQIVPADPIETKILGTDTDGQKTGDQQVFKQNSERLQAAILSADPGSSSSSSAAKESAHPQLSTEFPVQQSGGQNRNAADGNVVQESVIDEQQTDKKAKETVISHFPATISHAIRSSTARGSNESPNSGTSISAEIDGMAVEIEIPEFITLNTNNKPTSSGNICQRLPEPDEYKKSSHVSSSSPPTLPMVESQPTFKNLEPEEILEIPEFISPLSASLHQCPSQTDLPEDPLNFTKEDRYLPSNLLNLSSSSDSSADDRLPTDVLVDATNNNRRSTENTKVDDLLIDLIDGSRKTERQPADEPTSLIKRNLIRVEEVVQKHFLHEICEPSTSSRVWACVDESEDQESKIIFGISERDKEAAAAEDEEDRVSVVSSVLSSTLDLVLVLNQELASFKTELLGDQTRLLPRKELAAREGAKRISSFPTTTTTLQNVVDPETREPSTSSTVVVKNNEELSVFHNFSTSTIQQHEQVYLHQHDDRQPSTSTSSELDHWKEERSSATAAVDANDGKSPLDQIVAHHQQMAEKVEKTLSTEVADYPMPTADDQGLMEFESNPQNQSALRGGPNSVSSQKVTHGIGNEVKSPINKASLNDLSVTTSSSTTASTSVDPKETFSSFFLASPTTTNANQIVTAQKSAPSSKSALISSIALQSSTDQQLSLLMPTEDSIMSATAPPKALESPP